MNRREMLRAMGVWTAACLGLGCSDVHHEARSGRTVNGSVYDVRRFGAIGDSTALDTPAINRAVNAAFSAGGGTVYVPPGVYRSGTIILKSNVTLYLEAGATILGSKNIEDYTEEPGP